MPQNDIVFNLVKSLSSNEKGYFKTQSNTNSSKTPNYIRLFNALDSLQEYDEKKLVKKLKNKAIANKLSYEKNYLMEQLLHSLRSYHAKNRVDHQLKDLVKDVYLLFDKGQYELCMKRFKKAKNLAYKYDAYYIVMELIDWERKTALNLHGRNLKAKIEEWQHEKNGLLEIINNEREFTNIHNSMFVILKEGYTNKNEEAKLKAEKIINSPMMVNEDRAVSFRAIIDFNKAYGMYYQIIGEIEKAVVYKERVVHLWEENPHRIKADFEAYHIALTNYIGSCQFLGKRKEFLATIRKMKQYPLQSYRARADRFQNFYFHELFILLNLAKFDEALELMPEIEEGLTEYESVIMPSRIVSFFFNLAVVYFLLGRLEESYGWVQNIKNYDIDTRNDILQAARILELVILWEKGEYARMEYAAESNGRYFKRKEKVTDFERFSFGKVKGLVKLKDKQEIQDYLKTFLQELTLQEEPNVKMNPLLQEELRFWLQSRLRGVPMEVVFKESLAEEA